MKFQLKKWIIRFLIIPYGWSSPKYPFPNENVHVILLLRTTQQRISWYPICFWQIIMKFTVVFRLNFGQQLFDQSFSFVYPHKNSSYTLTNNSVGSMTQSNAFNILNNQVYPGVKCQKLCSKLVTFISKKYLWSKLGTCTCSRDIDKYNNIITKNNS